MSFRVNRNLGPFTTAAQTLFALKQWLCTSHPGTKHWSCVRSSDGISTGPFNVDMISNSGTGNGGLGNNGAWMVLRDPDSGREIEFANYGSSYNYLWYCMYSKGCLFTGGGTTTRATATDEKAFHLNRLPPASSGYMTFPSTGQWYTHIVAEGDTPDGDVYPFWCLSRVYSTGLPAACILMDCVIDSLSPAGDNDKAMLLASDYQYTLAFSVHTALSYGSAAGQLSGFMAYGLGGEEWGPIGGLGYHGSASVLQPGALGANPHDSKYGALPFFTFRAGGTTPGLKGQANLMRWKSASGMNYGDTIYDGTEYYLVADDIALRGWPDATGPTI